MIPYDPYKIEGPAIISTSGGRTSGFMLHRIIEAHGGELPPDVVPVFCNTGLEHEATYAFLREIGRRWCPITWLEYVHDPDGDRKHTYREVDYCSASRQGEPFAALLAAKQMLPNPVTRFCTSELKIRTANRWAKDRGWDAWDRAVGLRADEPRRAAKIKGNVAADDVALPMFDAGHTLEDVRALWARQPFDLELPGDDDAFGNCVGCFLKRRRKLNKVAQTDPAFLEWWARQEERTDLYADGDGRMFRNDRPTYRQMLTQIRVQGRLFDDAIEDDTLPCHCTD